MLARFLSLLCLWVMVLPSLLASPSHAGMEMLVRGTVAGAGNLGSDAVADELVWVVLPALSETFSYDGAGRLSGDAEWIYEWDGRGNLIQMERRAGTHANPTVTGEVVSFQYDGEGRRVKKVHTVSYEEEADRITESKMLWEGWLPMMEERKVNGVALAKRWFVWGRDVAGEWEGAGGVGGLVAIVEEGEEGRTLLPVDDGLGNIMAVVDAATGAVVAKYDHGPYGEVLGGTGELDASPFRYQSKLYDAETGHYYFGYRYYSPRMGKWLSRDPLGEAGGFNLYGYCGNDPVNKWDYLGLATRSDVENANNAAEQNLKLLMSLLSQLGAGLSEGQSVELGGAWTKSGLVSEIEEASASYNQALNNAFKVRAEFIGGMGVWGGLFSSNWETANAVMRMPTLTMPNQNALLMQSLYMNLANDSAGLLADNAGDLAQMSRNIENTANTASLALGVGSIGVQGTRILFTQGGNAFAKYGATVVVGAGVGYTVDSGVGWAGQKMGFTPEQMKSVQYGMSLFGALTTINKLNAANSAPNYVYRAVRADELATIQGGQGILRGSGGTTATQHVLGAKHVNNPWVSTTNSLESAQFFATHGGTQPAGTIIRIDLNKVMNPIFDVSNPGAASSLLKHPRAVNFSSAHGEVLIKGGINPDAISILSP